MTSICFDVFLFFFIMLLLPRISTLFPYTTLFRSLLGSLIQQDLCAVHVRVDRPRGALDDQLDADRRCQVIHDVGHVDQLGQDRKSTRLNSSHVRISYAVFCLKKKKNNKTTCLKYT